MSPVRALAAVPASVAAARRFIEETLGDIPPEQRDATVLMVSELVANAVLHAGGELTVGIQRSGDRIHVEVSDKAGGDPVAENPDVNQTRGRGLFIVEQLSDEWGVERHTDGKTVWFLLLVPEAGETSQRALLAK